MKKTFFSKKQTNSLAMQQYPKLYLNLKFFFHLFSANILAFALLFSPESTHGQCPATTFTVGSGVGIPNLSGAPAGLANMVGGSVKIWGSFTVDQGTWSLRGVKVYLRTIDAAIIVNKTCVLDARPNPSNNDRTEFENCNEIPYWLGIKVLPGGTTNLIDCNINSACTAVDLLPLSRSEIIGNYFWSNFYSINVEGSAILLGEGIAHNFFTAPPSALGCPSTNPYAIRLSNVPAITIGDIAQIGAPNSITGYSSGIHATNSNLTVYNTEISFTPSLIGAAIRLIGNGGVFQATINGLGKTQTSPTFINNCGRGIVATNYNLTVKNARFKTGATHIDINESLLPTQFDVSDCSFEEYSAYGIYLGLSNFSKLKVTKNEFRDNANSEPNLRSGVRLNFDQITSLNNKPLLSENKVYDDLKFFGDPLASYQHIGFWLNSTANVRMEDNFFYQNYLNPTGYDHEYKGIWVNNSDFSEIVSNSFLGNFGAADPNNGFKYRGLENNSSANSLISCNYADNLDAGLYFRDPGCNGNMLIGNILKRSVADLHLEAGTIIGLQKDRENKWPDNSPTEALFEGDPDQFLLQMSKFQINEPNQNSNLWANPRVPANGWFEFSGTAPAPTLICLRYKDPNEPPQTEAGKMVIAGNFESYKGYPASAWEASLGAFSVLMAHPELRPSGSPEALFYNLHDLGNLGKLQRAREDWNNIAIFSVSLESAWSNNETAISQKLDEIQMQNQQMQQVQDTTQQGQIAQTLTTLQGELNALQQTNQNFSAQYLTEVAGRANLLLSDLAAISTNDIWESNLKTVLSLLAQRQLVGVAEWSAAHQNILQSIADQCRHEGGIGVVIARAAIEQFNYDDEAMCPGFAQERTDEATSQFNATLAPNPANNLCRIVFDSAINGTLTLCDMQGRTQRNVQLVDAMSFDLDVKDLQIGLYYVQVKTEQGLVYSSKLAIAH